MNSNETMFLALSSWRGWGGGGGGRRVMGRRMEIGLGRPAETEPNLLLVLGLFPSQISRIANQIRELYTYVCVYVYVYSCFEKVRLQYEENLNATMSKDFMGNGGFTVA